MFDNPEVRNWVSVVLAAVMAGQASLADAFYFHQFGKDADLVLLMMALGGLGLHTVAVNAANTVTKTVNTLTK